VNAEVLAFFNNKGGVGKTTLVYHLAWMLPKLGHRIVAADLDPQANLTSAFLNEDELEEVWPENGSRRTIYASVEPLLKGTGDVAPPYLHRVDDGLSLIVGDLALSSLENDLNRTWLECMDGVERAFRVTSAFGRLLARAAADAEADLVLIDVGPNAGAINRSALIAADHVVVPLSPDLFSLRGLIALGPALRTWRREWRERRDRNPDRELVLPAGDMRPLGYVLLQHGIRLDRPARAYERWIRRIPDIYATAVLGGESVARRTVADDPNCLALLKHYHSLMPMAQEARKPVFHLTTADGAIGAHQQAVARAYDDFERLAIQIETRLAAQLSGS
jgi:cellulose biosynthesis protein BcsQ